MPRRAGSTSKRKSEESKEKSKNTDCDADLNVLNEPSNGKQRVQKGGKSPKR